MTRARWVVWACLVCAGCQLPASAVLDAPKLPTISFLGEEVELESSKLRDAALQVVPIGAPMAEAQAAFRARGFEVKSFAGYLAESGLPTQARLCFEDQQRLAKVRFEKHIYCRWSERLCEWGMQTRELAVVLIPDPEQKLQDLVVVHGLYEHPYRRFFEKHPDLREPVGLPMEQACERLRAIGFHCEAAKEGKAHMHCLAYDEKAIGGSMVRVNLYADEAGVVRTAEVERERPWFEAERSMLPRADESTTCAACKVALYPVRLGARYTHMIAVAALVGFCHGGIH